MKVRLFYKLLTVMLAVSLVPIALLGQRLISIGQLGVETAILELHLNMAKRIAGDLRGYVDRVDDRIDLVMDAMRKVGDSPAKLRAEIEKRRNFAGVSGIFNFSPRDHNGLSKDAFVMVRVAGGDWAPAR